MAMKTAMAGNVIGCVGVAAVALTIGLSVESPCTLNAALSQGSQTFGPPYSQTTSFRLNPSTRYDFQEHGENELHVVRHKLLSDGTYTYAEHKISFPQIGD